MQRQKKIGLTLLIVMLLGSLAIPYLMKNNKPTNEKLGEEAVNESIIKLCTLDAQNISRIEIKDDHLIILKKQDAKWTDADYNKLVYNDQAIEKMIKEITSLESIQVIHNVQEEKKYGINDNSRIITLYDEANNNYTFRLGSFTEKRDSLYIGTDVGETLYVVKGDEFSTLFQTRDDLISRSMIMPKAHQAEHIKISKRLEPDIYIRKSDQAGYKDYEKWILEGFFKEEHQLYTETVDAVIEHIITFEKDGFAGNAGSTGNAGNIGNAGNLAQYGLEDPELIITINEQTIKFGEIHGDEVYFMYDQEPYVYKMSIERLKAISELKPLEMIRKQVYIPDYSKLSQITLSKLGYTVDLIISKQIAADGFSLAGAIEETAFDELQTREIIQLITDSIMIEAVLQNPGIEQNSSRKAEVTINYSDEDNNVKMIELIPYDSSFYILRLEDKIEFAVGKEKVMNMFSTVSTLYEKVKTGDE